MKITTKADAALTLIWEAMSERRSKAALGRVRVACKILELAPEERREVESALEYRTSVHEPTYKQFWGVRATHIGNDVLDVTPQPDSEWEGVFE